METVINNEQKAAEMLETMFSFSEVHVRISLETETDKDGMHVVRVYAEDSCRTHDYTDAVRRWKFCARISDSVYNPLSIYMHHADSELTARTAGERSYMAGVFRLLQQLYTFNWEAFLKEQNLIFGNKNG